MADIDKESVVFDELDHADDWPDATVRESDNEPDDAGKEFLAELERRLTEKFDTPEVQAWLAEQEQV